jgi:hypothetical protein
MALFRGDSTRRSDERAPKHIARAASDAPLTGPVLGTPCRLDVSGVTFCRLQLDLADLRLVGPAGLAIADVVP